MTGSGPPRPREPTCSSCFVGRTAAGKVPGPCKPVVLEWFDDVRPRRVRVNALRAGASGFLLKDAPEDQLVATIRVAANGGAMFSPSITRRLIEAFTRRAAGLSNQEIAAKLVVGEHTAKTHVAHILQKLDLRDRVQAVVLAYESGLVQAGAAFSES